MIRKIYCLAENFTQKTSKITKFRPRTKISERTVSWSFLNSGAGIWICGVTLTGTGADLINEGLKPSPPPLAFVEFFSLAGLLLTGVTGFFVFQPGLNGSDLNGSDFTAAGAGVEVFSDETVGVPAVSWVSGVSGISDFGLASAETSVLASVGVVVGVVLDRSSGIMSFFCSGMGRESFGECLRNGYNVEFVMLSLWRLNVYKNWMKNWKNEKN